MDESTEPQERDDIIQPVSALTSHECFPAFPRQVHCKLTGLVHRKTIRYCPWTRPLETTWGCSPCPSGRISQSRMAIPLGGPQSLYSIKLTVYTHPGDGEPEKMKPNMWKGIMSGDSEGRGWRKGKLLASQKMLPLYYLSRTPTSSFLCKFPTSNILL